MSVPINNGPQRRIAAYRVDPENQLVTRGNGIVVGVIPIFEFPTWSAYMIVESDKLDVVRKMEPIPVRKPGPNEPVDFVRSITVTPDFAIGPEKVVIVAPRIVADGTTQFRSLSAERSKRVTELLMLKNNRVDSEIFMNVLDAFVQMQSRFHYGDSQPIESTKRKQAAHHAMRSLMLATQRDGRAMFEPEFGEVFRSLIEDLLGWQ